MIERPHATWAAFAGCVAIVLGTVPANAWQRRLRRAWASYQLAADAEGDVFTALPQRVHRAHEGTVAVVKLSHENGRELWRRSLKVPGPEHSDQLAGLVVTAEGDPVAAGTIEIAGKGEFAVTRLSGRTGRRTWQRIVRGADRPQSNAAARDVALDPTGDVVASGFLESETYVQYRSTGDFAVVKLSAVDGRELWRFVLDGTNHNFDVADRIAVDSAGDVLVVGTVADEVPNPGPIPFAPPVVTAFKLAGPTGLPLWRSAIEELVDVRAATRAGDGDLVVAGTARLGDLGNDFGIVRISGSDGTQRWVAAISGTEDTWETAFGVAVLPSGDVVGAGFVGEFDGHASLLVAAFDGNTGAERWRRVIEGTDGYGVGRAVAVTPSGNVVAGGRLRNTGSCYDIALVELAGTTGEVLSMQSFDGTTTARLCDSTCEYRCGFTPDGIDQDELYGLIVDVRGRAILAGAVDDGPRGRDRAFLAQVATRP